MATTETVFGGGVGTQRLRMSVIADLNKFSGRQRRGSSEKLGEQNQISVFARSSSRRRKVSCIWRLTYGASSKLTQSSNSIGSQFLETNGGKVHGAIWRIWYVFWEAILPREEEIG